MEKQIVKIRSIQLINHDVLRIITEKPPHFVFNPGQATEISINKVGWYEKKRPFTFTALPENDFLEFTIKTYPQHKGVTNELRSLNTDDELILHDVFGAISYKGEGVFIAGGAGVTPFICIFRYLESKNEIGDNKLIFANKTKDDILLEKEFKKLLGNNFINILSEENTGEYPYGQISEDFLTNHIGSTNRHYYLCGPPPMMDAVQRQLSNLGIDKRAVTIEDM